jgi:hypothetical protein
VTALVAIPYFGVSPELLDSAVTHALAQSHDDTVVLVAGDGARPPVSRRHDRLVVGMFARNRGTPMTQQAMVLGSPFEWYAPHGADDYVSREHVASLLALRFPAAGSSVVWYHEGDRAQILRSRRTWIEFGLFSTDLLRSIGGYNAAEPCGQDSVVIGILLQTSGVRLTRKPTYHKVYRPDSLTHDPRTRQGSPIRQAVKVRNREVLLACERIGWHNRAAIRAYRDSLVPAALRTELEDRAADVARWLS